MRKEITEMAWLCKPQRKKNSVTVKAVTKTFGKEQYIIVDICLDRPYVRIVLTKNGYEDYFPEEWKFEKGYYRSKTFKKGIGKSKIDTIFSYETFDDFKNLSIDNDSNKVICDFCGYKGSRYSWKPDFVGAIEQHEDKIYKASEERRWNKRLEKIHKDTDCIKAYPKKFETFIKKNIVIHYLFVNPFKGKKTTTAICSCCGKEVTVEKDRLPKKCPECGVKVIPTKRHNITNPDREFVLFQRIDGNYYQRHFGARFNVSFNHTGVENFFVYEKGCVMFDTNLGNIKTYFKKYDYYARKEFWDDVNIYGMNPIRLLPGITMFDCDIKTDERFKYSGIEYVGEVDPLFYLQRYLKMPEIEMLAKVGLKKLAVSINESDLVRGGKKPWEILGVDKVEFNRMRTMNVSVSELHWFQFEHKKGITIDDDDIRFLSGIAPERLDFIANKMSYKKIRNYLENQLKVSHCGIGELLGKWEDYIDMAKNFKKDLSLELNYKPKSIVIAHDELANIKMAEDRENEILEKFPDVNNIISSLAKYEFSDDKYCIVSPKSIKDIIKEGRILGHCLDRADRYFDRIERHESFILFLRKKSDPEIPFYSLEVEPNGTTRQKRTYGDRQDKDYQECVDFIRKWQRFVKTKLTKEDISYAEKSAVLREENFRDLRERQEKVWHGLLAGQLLVDVLEADLMVAD